MKMLSINAQTNEVKEEDFEMAANTVYTFFSSILIDELTTINGHVLYSDSEALSQRKPAYFIGEQLIVGDALIHAREGFEDKDVIITKEELESLINRDVSAFYKSALDLLAATDINLYRTFHVERKDESLELNNEWVLYTFNMADDRTKEYFLAELQKALENKEDIQVYLTKMATLALNSVS